MWILAGMILLASGCLSSDGADGGAALLRDGDVFTYRGADEVVVQLRLSSVPNVTAFVGTFDRLRSVTIDISVDGRHAVMDRAWLGPAHEIVAVVASCSPQVPSPPCRHRSVDLSGAGSPAPFLLGVGSYRSHEDPDVTLPFVQDGQPGSIRYALEEAPRDGTWGACVRWVANRSHVPFAFTTPGVFSVAGTFTFCERSGAPVRVELPFRKPLLLERAERGTGPAWERGAADAAPSAPVASQAPLQATTAQPPSDGNPWDPLTISEALDHARKSDAGVQAFFSEHPSAYVLRSRMGTSRNEEIGPPGTTLVEGARVERYVELGVPGSQDGYRVVVSKMTYATLPPVLQVTESVRQAWPTPAAPLRTPQLGAEDGFALARTFIRTEAVAFWADADVELGNEERRSLDGAYVYRYVFRGAAFGPGLEANYDVGINAATGRVLVINGPDEAFQGLPL